MKKLSEEAELLVMQEWLLGRERLGKEMYIQIENEVSTRIDWESKYEVVVNEITEYFKKRFSEIKENGH